MGIIENPVTITTGTTAVQVPHVFSPMASEAQDDPDLMQTTGVLAGPMKPLPTLEAAVKLPIPKSG